MEFKINCARPLIFPSYFQWKKKDSSACMEYLHHHFLISVHVVYRSVVGKIINNDLNLLCGKLSRCIHAYGIQNKLCQTIFPLYISNEKGKTAMLGILTYIITSSSVYMWYIGLWLAKLSTMIWTYDIFQELAYSMYGHLWLTSLCYPCYKKAAKFQYIECGDLHQEDVTYDVSSHHSISDSCSKCKYISLQYCVH